MRRTASLALAFSLLVALPACATDRSSSQSTSSKSSGTTQPTGLSATNPGCKYIVAATQRRFTFASSDFPTEYLTSAVAEPFTCYDKVTFTFDKGDGSGLPPAYLVEYRKKPFGLLGPDGKGIITSVGSFKQAKSVLYVEMIPTATKDPNNPRRFPATGSYPGNLRLLLKGMKHVVMVEWVDKLPETLPAAATTTTVAGATVPPPVQRIVWLIGLDAKRPFTVDYASDPQPHINVLIMR